MWMTKLEEHLAHSAPCVSQFDGFDRGDDGWRNFPDEEELDALADEFVGPRQEVVVGAMVDLSDLDELEIIF